MTAATVGSPTHEGHFGFRVLVIFVLTLLAAIAQEVYTTWLSAPADLTTELFINASILIGFGLVWCVAWSALSRVFRKRWLFLIHCSIYLGVGAVYRTATDIYTLSWFAFDWPESSYFYFDVAVLVLTTVSMIYLHARVALGELSLIQTLGFVLVPIGLSILGLWFLDRQESKNVDSVGVGSRIYPPAFRLHPATPFDDFFGTARQLRGQADKARDNLPASDEEMR